MYIDTSFDVVRAFAAGGFFDDHGNETCFHLFSFLSTISLSSITKNAKHSEIFMLIRGFPTKS